MAYFVKLSGSDEEARRCVLQARAQGKGSSQPCASDVRITVPQGAQQQILDVLIADRLSASFPACDFRDSGFFIGAQKGTQCLDVTFGLSQAVEKMCDDNSRGGIAQMDIRAYYDSFSLLLICRWLCERAKSAEDLAVAASLLRWQLLPGIRIQAGVC